MSEAPPFKKVLIANRGEIAVRVIRACREMGIPTVAIYSDVDRGALHVRFADEAYPCGPPPARESYLVAERVLEIAKACGADGIHPGLASGMEKAHALRTRKRPAARTVREPECEVGLI